MITILYTVNELKIGGAEQQLLELVRGLDKARFRPIIAPLYPNGSLDPEFRSIPGVQVLDLNRRGKYDPSPLWRIAMLLRRERVDIVQPFLSPATFFGLLPALVVGTPITIVTERCGVRRVRGLGYKVYRTIEDKLSHLADAIVPNSIAGGEMLVQRGLPKSKIRVIYNGINDDRLRMTPDNVTRVRAQLRVPDDGEVIGILASLTLPKGHDTLLRAMVQVRDSFPAARLAIVGDGPRRPALEELTAALGLEGRVIFFGYQRNVADFLDVFDLLVSASCDNEGCSNSILEAMAMRVPVIATSIGGNRELVRERETGMLVPVGDPVALADAICTLLGSTDTAEAYAGRAREMIESQFSLDRMVRDYETLYTELLSPERKTASDADGLVVMLRG